MIGNFLDQYLITARLGSGSLGETYLGESVLDRSKVVLTLVDPELAAKPDLLKTVCNLGQLNAPYVRPFTCEASDGQTYLLMLDHFPDNLQSYLAKLEMQKKEIKTEQAVSLILHLISRLCQINYTQLKVHGALHPRNMLVKLEENDRPSELILADFLQADMARQATAAADQPVRGLAPFTPPWLWVKTEEGKVKLFEANGRTDLFALGHLLYFLLKNEYLHVAQKHEENQALDNQYREVRNRIIRNEKVDKRNLADYAELAALTAVRVPPHVPENSSEDAAQDNSDSVLWQQWHHALLTMHRGEFNLTNLRVKISEIPEEENSALDEIWQIRNPLDFLTPDAPEAQLDLPGLRLDEAPDNEEPPEVERPSLTETYIEISRPRASNGDRQQGMLYQIRADQGRITVGSHSDKDICLTQDANVGPHHLDIRLVGGRWELYARGSRILLNGTAVSPGQPEVWSPAAAVDIGSYRLHLRQPAAITTAQLFDVELLPIQLNLQQGHKGQVGIAIRNNGDERSYFIVEETDSGSLEKPESGQQPEPETAIENKGSAWFSLPKNGLVLNPGEQQEIFLTVHPPRDQVSQTRLYRVTVYRLGYADQKTVVMGRIFLQATTDFDTHLTAVSSQNRGEYRLIIRNKSNKQQTYQVDSVDELKALEFAVLKTTVEETQPTENKPRNSQPRRTNGRSPFNIFNSPLFNRAVRQAGGGQIVSDVSAVRRQTRRIQTTLSRTGSLLPRTQLEFPKLQQPPKYEETFQEKKSIPPGQQAVIFFKAKPRKRPFRYQPHREIPFKLTIAPIFGAEGKAREETAVFHVTSRLSRPVWALLLGLLLFVCLLLTGLTAVETSNTASALLATQESARIFSATDLENDSLPSYSEVAIHHTNPQKRDTDGDGMMDGLEISLESDEICATKIDCDGDGIPDVREVYFATPTPTPPGGLPFVTAEPPPAATRIPTVTPTSTAVAQNQPTRTASIQFSRSDLDLTLGDNRDNEPQIIELTFNTANQLPANAVIQEAALFVVMRNPEQYGRLRQELGNIYATEGINANQEQLGGLAEGSANDLANLQIMDLAYNTDNILLTTLPTVSRGDNGVVTIRLFFELGSDLDGQADLLQLWSNHDQQSSLEHPPTLQITYSLPGNSP